MSGPIMLEGFGDSIESHRDVPPFIRPILSKNASSNEF
jgi:hypothetical protein